MISCAGSRVSRLKILQSMVRCLFWDCHDSYDWILVTINTKYALRGVYSTGKSDCLVLPKVFCIGTEIGINTMKELTIFGLIMPKTLLQFLFGNIDHGHQFEFGF